MFPSPPLVVFVRQIVAEVAAPEFHIPVNSSQLHIPPEVSFDPTQVLLIFSCIVGVKKKLSTLINQKLSL